MASSCERASAALELVPLPVVFLCHGGSSTAVRQCRGPEISAPWCGAGPLLNRALRSPRSAPGRRGAKPVPAVTGIEVYIALRERNLDAGGTELIENGLMQLGEVARRASISLR